VRPITGELICRTVGRGPSPFRFSRLGEQGTAFPFGQTAVSPDSRALLWPLRNPHVHTTARYRRVRGPDPWAGFGALS